MAQAPLQPGGATGKATTSTISGAAAGGGVATLSGADLQHFAFWGVGAATLIVLAEFAPKPAIILTGLIGLGVVLRFSTQLQSWLSSATSAATGGAQASEPSGAKTRDPSGTGGTVVSFPKSPFVRSLIRDGGMAG